MQLSREFRKKDVFASFFDNQDYEMNPQPKGGIKAHAMQLTTGEENIT
jgi:hypothetical protein